MKKAKVTRAWAVFHSGGCPDTWDERVPVYWYKRTAVAAAREHSFADSRVIPVEIRPVAKRRKVRR
jgi:hypothetical protein